MIVMRKHEGTAVEVLLVLPATYNLITPVNWGVIYAGPLLNTTLN